MPHDAQMTPLDAAANAMLEFTRRHRSDVKPWAEQDEPTRDQYRAFVKAALKAHKKAKKALA